MVLSDFTPRRSTRLSGSSDDRAKTPVQRAQEVLMRRWGIVTEKEKVSNEAFKEYLKLFSKPLAPLHLRAVAALYDCEDNFEEEDGDEVDTQALALPEEAPAQP